MMTVEESKKTTPPYISFKSLNNMLDRLKSEGVPRRIDRSYWGGFLNGSMGAQMMVALRSLGLVDQADSPTDDLERLAGADVTMEDRKRELVEVLNRRYPEVMALDLPRASWGMLEEVFRKTYGLEGETRRKAIAFFINAAQFAGVPLSPHITKRVRTRNAPARTGNRAGGKKPPANGQEQTRQEPTPPPTGDGKPGGSRSIRFRGGGTVTIVYSLDLFDLDSGEREFLLSLIDKMQEYEEKLHRAERGEPSTDPASAA